ncbi:MAG: flavodoxin family protein [Candidatus Omnitrophica bacterium]|nr:flavodoxin family protein [Candidatus Omnitrophota bacterium]
MKIVLIASSPRKEKSQTLVLAKEVLRGCAGPEEPEVIHLCDYRMEFCQHCEKCHEKILQCPIQDDVFPILDKLLKADGIILASPNYINQVTASLKTLFDRSTHFIHCQRLLGKYIAGVVSSGSGRDKEVLDYLKYYSHICGAQFVGGVDAAVPVSDAKKAGAFKLGTALKSAIQEKRAFPDQLKSIEAAKTHFKPVMEKRKDEWAEEYKYWKDKGWL